MSHDRRRKVMLGGSLLWKVKQLAKLSGRPVGPEIVFLCRLAIQAPGSIPVGAGKILGDDQPRSGTVTMSWNPEVDAYLRQRADKMEQSYSETVRALVVRGICIEEIRLDELGELYGRSSKEDQT